MPIVAIVMGSKSDMPVVEPVISTLKRFGVSAEVRVLSAHRTPVEAAACARTARERGVEAIIAVAGKAAHLPGVLAAYTTLPVIGLPVKSSFMDGLDSLLSMVQMPNGVPVATVGVNGSQNAALLAVQILSVKYADLAQKLNDDKAAMAQSVLEQDAAVKEELQ